jgi:hypothetical protein
MDRRRTIFQRGKAEKMPGNLSGKFFAKVFSVGKFFSVVRKSRGTVRAK